MAARYFKTKEEREAALTKLRKAGLRVWEWQQWNLFVLQTDFTQAEMDKILDAPEEKEKM